MQLVGLLAAIYLFTFVAGLLLEEIRIPWIFAALILGTALSVTNPFGSLTSGEAFKFIAETGMYLMLFLIGFELDIDDMKSKSTYILESAFFIILLEGFVGSLLVHFVFGYGWIISLLVSISFATVGEGMLLPILEEFDLLDTELGEIIIGIGIMDDTIEVMAVIATSALLGVVAGHGGAHIGITIAALSSLVLLTYGFTRFSKEGKDLRVWDIETIFLALIFIFFLFVAVGGLAEASALGALLAGVSVKNFMPQERLETIEDDLRSIAYGLFGPVFFTWIGLSMNLNYLIQNIWLVVLVVGVSNLAKITGSWITGHRRLGLRKSIVMGVGLSVRFSTSLVIVKLLHEGGIIQTELYSVLIASTAVFTFLVPGLMTVMATRWDLKD